MDHENRIKRLEKQNQQKDDLIKALALRLDRLESKQQFLPVSEIQKRYFVSAQRIKKIIRTSKRLTEGLDYIMNGRNYLLNVDSVEKVRKSS